MKDRIKINGKEQDTLDVMNPAGTFIAGERIRPLTLKDSPSLAGRLIPEFDRRNNIRDMFMKKPSTPASGKVEAALAGEERKGSKAATTESPHNSCIQSTDDSPRVAVSTTPPKLALSNTPKASIAGSKRASVEMSPSRPLKRSKSGSAPNGPARAGVSKGQQSLKGFFVTRSAAPAAPRAGNRDAAAVPAAGQEAVPSAARESRDTTAELDADELAHYSQMEAQEFPKLEPGESLPPADPNRPFSVDEAEDVFDPIASKDMWAKLFSKPAIPTCESHGEQCISLTTKKPGINCGRVFWICPR